MAETLCHYSGWLERYSPSLSQLGGNDYVAGPVVTANLADTTGMSVIGTSDITHANMPSNVNGISQTLSTILKLTNDIIPVKVNTV